MSLILTIEKLGKNHHKESTDICMQIGSTYLPTYVLNASNDSCDKSWFQIDIWTGFYFLRNTFNKWMNHKKLKLHVTFFCIILKFRTQSLLKETGFCLSFKLNHHVFKRGLLLTAFGWKSFSSPILQWSSLVKSAVINFN